MTKTVPLTARETLVIEGESPSELETPNEVALDLLIQEFGDDATDAKVTVWRCLPREPGGKPGAQKEEFLLKMTPNDFLQYGLEGIQADYGEGTYKVLVFGTDPASGRKGSLRKNRTFSVGPLNPIRKAQIEREREAEERRQLARAQPQTPDMSAGITALANAMLTGFRELQQTIQSQRGNKKEMLEELAQMKTLFAPAGGMQPAPSTGLGDQLQSLTAIVGLAKELGSPATPGVTTGMDLLKELIEQFGEPLGEVAKVALAGALVNRGRGMQQPQIAHISAPGPAAPPAPAAPGAWEGNPLAGNVASGNPLTGAPATAPTNGADNVDLFGMALKKYLPDFVLHAANGHDPETYAIMIVETVPEQILINFVARPDAIDYLAGLNPGVNQFRPWFEQLLAIVKDELTAPPDENITGAIDGNSTTLQ